MRFWVFDPSILSRCETPDASSGQAGLRSIEGWCGRDTRGTSWKLEAGNWKLEEILDFGFWMKDTPKLRLAVPHEWKDLRFEIFFDRITG